MTTVIKSIYDGKRTKVALKCGKTMTQQNFKDEALEDPQGIQ